MAHQWSPSDYRTHASFVPALGESVLERFAPRPGEHVLDLGCGDGVLTARIVEAGATVVGVDASASMVAAARARGLDARVVDVRQLTFEQEFDGVFSNAVLHWVPEADAVLRGLARALRPGGRLVAEFGGHTNVAAIATAARAVCARRGYTFRSPWYYPTPDEYRRLLVGAGFVVRDIRLVPRPTPLPTGMVDWLRTFGVTQYADVPATLAADVEAEIAELLAPALCDLAGRWTADYVRLQVDAALPGA